MATVRIQCQDCATAMETDGGNDDGVETMWCPKCHPGFCPKCGREDTPAASLGARPQEPGLFTKRLLDEIIDSILEGSDADNPTLCLEEFRDSILNLAPSGPLSDEPRENENQDVAAPSVGREQIALKVLNDNDWHGAWGTVEETVALLREAGVFDESSVPSCWCGKNRDEVAAPSVGELE